MSPKTITIYGIKNCNTMQKAFTLITKNGIESHFHDYKKEGISAQKIEEWFKKAPWEQFINKQGLTWKKLDESIRSSITDAAQASELMQKHTSLIRRPIVEAGDMLIIGFQEEQLNALK